MKTLAVIAVLSLVQVTDPIAQGDISVDTQIYSFAERQQQLIDMAELLGQIHHLHQICQPYDYFPERYRNRMKELVTLEEPVLTTRNDMVAAFNDGFQSTKARFDYCGPEAETEMRSLGADGTELTRQLAGPFRRHELTDKSAD